MIADQDVVDLYRCLLGRTPEGDATIQAFKAYYPDFARGQRGIFGSDEFSAVFAAVTGRAPATANDTTASLTRAFLERAGGPATPPADAVDSILRHGMLAMCRAHGAVKLAVIVGEAAAVSTIAPLRGKQTAILHVADSHPAILPRLTLLTGGATLFQAAFQPHALAGLLQDAGVAIDLLCLLGAPANTAWAQALLPRLAARAIVVTGSARPGFAPSPIDDIFAAHWAEPAIAWQGTSLRHIGGAFMPVSYAQPQTPLPPPATEPDTKLALAVIMKNEAGAVLNMLRSVAPAISFFAITDTGSTDNTVPMVRAFLEQSGKPFILESIAAERFDTMRNAALDLVPDWCAWTLMLDADEEMSPEDLPKLLASLPLATADAYALPRYNYPGPDKSGDLLPYPDRQVRLLRNTADRRTRYSGAVHETVRDIKLGLFPLDASALGGPRGGPHIHHLVRRFRTPVEESAKQAHYRDIADRHAK